MAKHDTCKDSGFCVDFYVGEAEKPCSAKKRAPEESEAHKNCSGNKFCVDHYSGTAREPCRSAGLG